MLIIVFIIALIMGSFFNVVILRYPEMLKQFFVKECANFLPCFNDFIPNALKNERINLIYPCSYCPNCKKNLKWFHLVPVFSYLFLKGHCGFCHAPISYLYPIVEILTGILTVLVFLHFGIELKTIAGIIFTWILILVTCIDIRTLLIPDTLSLSLLWLGLLFNLTHLFTSLNQAVIGAIVGYVFLFTIAKIFYWVRHQQGMGEGDFKLFAALGAWFGCSWLLIILLIAIMLSFMASIIMMCIRREFNLSMAIPFAPFLSVSGMVLLFRHI